MTSSTQAVVNIENKVQGNNGGGSSVAKWCADNFRAILGEVLATSFLVLLGCMGTIPVDGLPYQSPMYAPLCFGFVVSVNVHVFGHISGAHMNPAVSVAAMIWGSLSIVQGIAYILAQCSGAIIGYGILTTVAPIDVGEIGACTTVPHIGINVWQAMGIEIVLTSLLNFLNCGVWDPVNKDKPDSVPIKFGLAIAGLSLAGGPITGASMNPARTLGPAIFTGVWQDHWLYWVGPIIGGILPPVIYKLLWLKKDKAENQD